MWDKGEIDYYQKDRALNYKKGWIIKIKINHYSESGKKNQWIK